MNLYDRVLDILGGMDTEDLVSIHNEYCDNNKYMDDYIYNMCDFDDMNSGRLPSEVLNDIGDNFNINDDYFVCGLYGFDSFDYADDDGSPVCIEDIAKYIVNNMDDLGNDDIKDLLESEEEDDDGDE